MLIDGRTRKDKRSPYIMGLRVTVENIGIKSITIKMNKIYFINLPRITIRYVENI